MPSSWAGRRAASVDEVDHLLLDRRGAHRGWRLGRLLAAHLAQQIHRHALGLEAHVDHARTQQLDGVGVGGVQHGHGHLVAGAEALLAHLAQQVAHVHGHIAKVDLDRARRSTCGTPCSGRPRLQTLPVLDGHAAARLLFVQKARPAARWPGILLRGLYSRLARGTWVEHTGLHLPQRRQSFTESAMAPMSLLLHDERLVPHQPKAGRVGVGQIGMHGAAFEAFWPLALVQQARAAPLIS